MGALIVLAEDDADLRSIYSACLRAAGFEVWEAADGAEAVSLVSEKQPALLILDVWMPALNGFEVLERLRHDPCASGLKVVMLSNLGDSDARLESFSVGALEYWVKGISLAELTQRVQRVLADLAVANAAALAAH